MLILFPLQLNTLGHEGSRILPLFARVLVELEGGDSLLKLFIHSSYEQAFIEH